MAALLIAETDVIDVSSLSILIYGPPGAWKTSLAQTANHPLTLDFDRGAHRAFNRRSVLRLERWADLDEARDKLVPYQTICLDTVGRALDLLTADIIAANARHGSAAGGLTIQGYGALKARFGQWVNLLRSGGKDLVLIAHEKEEKDGDDRYLRPDIQGGSYTEVMKFTDLVGYVSLDRQGRRTIDFNPSDRHLGKNAAGWGPLPIPDLAQHPTFLADLLADAKHKIGQTAAQSAAVAEAVQAWQDWLAKGPTLDQFNGNLADLSALTNGAKKQAWHLIQQYAEAHGWTWAKESKAFTPKQGEAA